MSNALKTSMGERFAQERSQVMEIFSHWSRAKDKIPQMTFEERFYVLELNWRLEDLLDLHLEASSSVAVHCFYCLFGHSKRLCHARLTSAEFLLAQKIKNRMELSLPEKADALRLFSRLS